MKMVSDDLFYRHSYAMGGGQLSGSEQKD